MPKKKIEPEEAPYNRARMDRFVALTARKRKLEAELELIGEELSDLNETLVLQFEAAGLNSIKTLCDDKRATVYTAQDIKAFAPTDPTKFERLAAVLRRMKHGHLVKRTINFQSLSALVRELYNDETKGVPKELEDACAIQIKSKLIVRLS